MLARKSVCWKKSWFGLLSVIFLISMSFAGLLNFSPVIVLADNANNDTVANAEEILPDTHNGSLNATDLVDYYKIQLVPGTIISISFAADSVNNQDLNFYDKNEVEVFSLVSSASALYSDSYYLANETTTNYWYIKISTFDGFGNYNFTLSIQKQNDAGTGDDVPADFGNAVEISPGVQIPGHLEDLDVTDMYKVYITSDSIVNITFAADSGTNQDLDFYDSSLTDIFNLYSSASTEYSDMYYLANETTDNYWYIKISTFDGFGNYNFTLTITFQDDAGSGGDVPADFTNAFEIMPDTQISGHLEDLDTVDMYKVNLSSGSIVTITFAADSLYTQDLDFYLPSKIAVFNLLSSNSINVSDNYTIANETASGYWHIKVSTFDGFDNYNFTVSVLAQNDGESGKDVAQDFDNAHEVETGIWHSGYLGDLDIKDMYKVLVGGGYKVFINFSYTTDGYLTLTFYDQDRNQQFTLPSTTVDPINTGGAVIPDFWFVSVDLISGTWGDYSFSVIVEKLDLTPPKIFNITVDPSEYFVVITWNTDVNTTGTVYYGFDETYGSEADSISYFTTNHIVYINDAEPGKQYHFKIVSYSELDSKNESADAIFKMPISTEYVEPQYNSLRTFIFGESVGTTRAYSVGSQVKITVYCFDKGVAIKPDTLNVTSDTAVDDIAMTEVTTGKYTGTYTLTQADIDGGTVNIYADVKYQGDNDTAILTFDTADETEGDWEVNIDYFAPDDRKAGSGDTVNLKVIVTKDGAKAEPANIYASVQEEGYYGDRRGTRSRFTELTPTKIATGEYKISYPIPTVYNESTAFEFEVDISDTTYSEYDYFSHDINFYRVWYHQISLTETAAEYDLYATDLDNIVIPNANFVLNWTYYTLEYNEKGGELNKQTDSNGKANFKFNYPDIGENYIEIYGRVTANGKTQHFDQYLSIYETDGGFIPEPYGEEFEIIPIVVDGSPYSYYDATPDAQGNIKRFYTAYSYSEPLANTKIFYYIISGSSPYYGYYSSTLDMGLSVVKFGSATTNDTGVFSVEVKHSTTRAEPNFAYYTIYAETALGNFAEFNPYSEVTSRDGKYYGEAFNYFYVSGIPYLFTLNDLISGDIKITIPKLNKGTETDIDVTYSGSFSQPQVMVNFLPGTISIDTPAMEMSMPDWGLWTDDEGTFLTKSNGKFSGKFTIPAFMPGDTFTIMVIVQDYMSVMDSEVLTSIADFTKINLVILKVGNSVTNGGYEGPTDGPPILDSDLDGYIDDIEKFYGTDPQDPTSYPGSTEGEAFEQQTVNNVEVLVLAKTNGNITIKPVSPTGVPVIPKNIGKSFNFFIDISCDEACSDVQIVLDLGKIGGDIIPTGTDPKSIKLFYYDETTSKWTEVADSSYNKNTGILTAKLDHLTVFSPMSKTAEKDGETDEESKDLLMYILLLIIIVGVISAFGVTLRKRKKGKGDEGGMVDDRIDYYDSGEGGDMEYEEPPREPKIEPERGIPEKPGPAPPTDKGPETVAQKETAVTTTPEPPTTPAPTPPKTTAEHKATEEAGPQEEKTVTAETAETPPTTDEPQSAETPATEPTQEPSVQPPEQEVKTPETETSEPEKPAQPAAQKTEAPKQMVPCPTCQKEIPVYSSPCPHCGTSLNW